MGTSSSTGSAVTASADIELAESAEMTTEDVDMDTEQTIEIELTDHTARMLDELREEYGSVIDQNIERELNQLISNAYLDDQYAEE